MKKIQNPEEEEGSTKVAGSQKQTQFLSFLANIDETCMQLLENYLMENKDQIGKKERFELIDDALLLYTVKNYEKDIHTKQKFKEVCGILHEITGFSVITISERLRKKLCKVPIEDLKEHVALGASLTFKNKNFVRLSTKSFLKKSEQFPNFMKIIQKSSEPVRYHEFNDFKYYENEPEDKNILIYLQKDHNTIKIGSVKDRQNRELGINRLMAIGIQLNDKSHKSNKNTNIIKIEKAPKIQPLFQSPPVKKKVKKLKPILKVEYSCVSPKGHHSEKTIEKKEKHANASSKDFKRANSIKQIGYTPTQFLKTEQKTSKQIEIKSESATTANNKSDDQSKVAIGKLIPRLYPKQTKNETQNSDISEDCPKQISQSIKLESQQ